MSSGDGSTHSVVCVSVEKWQCWGFEISQTPCVARSSGGGRGFPSSPRRMRPLQPLHLDIFPCTKHPANGSPTAGLVLAEIGTRGGGDPRES